MLNLNEKLTINGFKSKAAAIRFLKERGHKICTLLASPESNPKIEKNGKVVDVFTYALHLAPFNLSGFQVCAMASDGCAKACLHTSGNPAYMETKEQSRIAKTRAYFQEREAFLAVLVFEMIAAWKKAQKNKQEIAFRLNATSDLPWEKRVVTINGEKLFIFDIFADIQFYDYTAFPKRVIAHAMGCMPKNYHLTFSRKENNQEHVDAVLNGGGNVAAVLSRKLYKQALEQGHIVLNGYMRKVTDGDAHDYRPNDPLGTLVILKAKGDAIRDTSGFVIQAA